MKEVSREGLREWDLDKAYMELEIMNMGILKVCPTMSNYVIPLTSCVKELNLEVSIIWVTRKFFLFEGFFFFLTSTIEFI